MPIPPTKDPSPRVRAGSPECRLKLYVAAASSETDRVHWAIETAKASGFQIVCTWPDIVATVGDANPRDVSRDARFGWSSQDLAEVDESDALWFLVPSGATTRGAWVEAGFAFAVGKQLVFSGDTKQSVFCALGEEFATDAEALDYLCRIARDRAALRGAVAEIAEAQSIVDPVIAGLIELRDAAQLTRAPWDTSDVETEVVDEADITAEVVKR